MAMHSSWELKRKKSFIILQLIKIIFVTLFFSILLFSNGKALKQNTLNSLNSLKLTLSNSHLSISLPSARLDPQHHQPIEARRHQPTSWPISSNFQADPSPKPSIHASEPRIWSAADPHLRPISAFSDALNSLKLTLSNSLKLSPLNSHLFIPPLIHTSDPTRLQVSCLYLFHIHA